VCNPNYVTRLASGLALALVCAQARGQVSKGSDLGLKSSFVGGTLTCTQLPSSIHVPQPLMERAKVKARLAILLGESLADDASGIVNVAREKEIKKLANKLGRERE
jgi:hypothetical protein